MVRWNSRVTTFWKEFDWRSAVAKLKKKHLISQKEVDEEDQKEEGADAREEEEKRLSVRAVTEKLGKLELKTDRKPTEDVPNEVISFDTSEDDEAKKKKEKKAQKNQKKMRNKKDSKENIPPGCLKELELK